MTQQPEQSDSRDLLEAISRLREVAQSEWDRLGVELERGSTTMTLFRWTAIGKALAFADEVTASYGSSS